MALSPKRKLGVKRRAKKAAGLEGLVPSFLPEIPSLRSIIRQLLAGLFSKALRGRKRIVKKTYELKDLTEITNPTRDIHRAFKTAATQTTLQSMLHVLGEMIYSTPIVTSALAQGWRISRSRQGGAFNPKVARLNHEAVFYKAQAAASPEMERVMASAKKMFNKGETRVDLHITNPAPYLEEARPTSYWQSIMKNAWLRQQAKLQKTFDDNAKKLGL